MKAAAQKVGKFLSAMIMPLIGVFIAWGLMTAMFLTPGGWFPNENLYAIVPVILTYLLPVLIAFQGGYMVGGLRGSLVGAIAIVGVICGKPETTMLMAAMIVGPFSGWLIKKFDQFMEKHMPAGFEMLINNFSAGILGLILCIIGYYAIAPVMDAILSVLATGVSFLIEHSLLPFVAIFLEPAKVLFLNNAINHGIFTPLGADDVANTGKSIMFMIESNPGPGLGVLLAFWAFSPDKSAKRSAPGAVIIHFFGGIHEIYFPYILSRPAVIIGPIVGNFCALIWFSFMDAGLMGPASPGSIISFIMMSPRDTIWVSAIGVAIAAAVSFVISSPILKLTKGKSIEEATAQKDAMKAESKGITGKVSKVVFACDAGMGSSAMGATKFKKRLKTERPDIKVVHSSVDSVPEDANIVVCQTTLKDRAASSAPQAQLVTIGNFLDDPALDSLYEQLIKGDADDAEAVEETANSDLKLTADCVHLGVVANTQKEILELMGFEMFLAGLADAVYAEALFEREKVASTYMGMGIAIPHGTNEARSHVRKAGIVFIQVPQGVPYGDEKAYLLFGICGQGDEHLDLLAKISEQLDDPDTIETLKTTKDVDDVLKIFNEE
ncbi:MAG: PTS mannitol transporter subunit IICBA [Coriobacteriia bacterium]|nr:PTS mannitol transporter subunit IICBA [Coriobacteriia bacterium]